MIAYEKYFVPSGKKERQSWMEKILDTVSRYYGSTSVLDRRWKYWQIQQRIRGEINPADYEYIWNMWGLPKPMSFVNYPLLETHIDGLVGSFMASQLQYDVWKVNENAVSEKMDMKTKLTFMKLAEPYLKQIEATMGVNLPIMERMKNLPEGVKKYENYDVRDMLEDAIFYDLYDLILRYKIQTQFANCLNDICENGFAYGKVCYDGKNPYIEQVPIIEAICDLPITSQPYSDTTKQNIGGRDHFLNVEQIYDYYGNKLDDDDMEKIESSSNSFQESIGTNSNTPNAYVNYFRDPISNEVYIRVVDIQVRAFTNKQFVTAYADDEQEKTREEQDMKEVHCGVKIGKDVYKTWKKENQIPYKDNYTDLQLDYFGVFTKSNLYRKAWGFQMLYNVINMNIEFQVNQSGGKAIRYNMANKPEGQEIDDITYNAKVGGIIAEQPQPGSTGSVVGNEVDFGLGVGFQYMIMAKKVVEESMGILTGVTPDRLGAGSPYQSQGLAQSNLQHSTFVTAPMFYAHANFIEIGLQKMSDLVKYLHAEDSTRSVVIGDMGLKVFQTTSDMSNYDYGIYVKSFTQDVRKNQMIDAYVEKVLATDATFIDTGIATINAVSGKEKQKIVSAAMAHIREMEAQKAQSDQKVAEMGVQIEAQKLANDKLRAEAARYSPIDVANINKKGKTEDTLLSNYLDEQKNLNQQGHERDLELMSQTHDESMQQNQPPPPAQ